MDSPGMRMGEIGVQPRDYAQDGLNVVRDNMTCHVLLQSVSGYGAQSGVKYGSGQSPSLVRAECLE